MSSLHLDSFEGWDAYIYGYETRVGAGAGSSGTASLGGSRPSSGVRATARTGAGSGGSRSSGGGGGSSGGGGGSSGGKSSSGAGAGIKAKASIPAKASSGAGAGSRATASIPKRATNQPARANLQSRFSNTPSPKMQKAIATAVANLKKPPPKSWGKTNPYYEDALSKEIQEDADYLNSIRDSQKLRSQLEHLENKYSTGADDLPGTLNVYGDAALRALNSGESNPTLNNIPNSLPRTFDNAGGWTQVQYMGGAGVATGLVNPNRATGTPADKIGDALGNLAKERLEAEARGTQSGKPTNPELYAQANLARLQMGSSSRFLPLVI